MIPSGSIDFVFSFDSLVHADADALRGYVVELRRVLSRNGVAFLHHSNVAALPEDVRTDPEVTRHERSPDVSAEIVRMFGVDARMGCLNQEVVSWGGNYSRHLTDCFSVLVRSDAPRAARHTFRRRCNPTFMEDVQRGSSAASSV